jgi:hypothetical protein
LSSTTSPKKSISAASSAFSVAREQALVDQRAAALAGDLQRRVRRKRLGARIERAERTTVSNEEVFPEGYRLSMRGFLEQGLQRRVSAVLQRLANQWTAGPDQISAWKGRAL